MKHVKLYEEFVNEALKSETPNEVITIEVDMTWDNLDKEEDKAAKAAFKKYKIKVEPMSLGRGRQDIRQEGTFEVTGKKKDILAYLQSEFYEMDADAIEEYYPELLESITEASTGAVDQFAADEREDGYDAKVFLGRFDGIKTFKAQVTNKTWKDGTPVTKYFSRGGFKDVKLKGEYQLVDSDRGWWYIQGPAGDWFAVKHDEYGTPPFEF